MARPKKQTGDAGANPETGEGGSQTTGAGNNAHRARARAPTLSARIRQMDAKLDRILDQNQRIVRGVS